MPHIGTVSASRPTRPLAAALALLLALAPGIGRAAGEGPRTVSPGGLGEITDAASSCPTFSWAAATGAAGYELVVLQIAAGAEPKVTLREAIDGSALGWTPDRSRCLAPGDYAWTVRALGGEEEAAWAPVRHFAVAAQPSPAEVAAALETLRRWEASRSADPRNSPGTFPSTFPTSGNSPGTLRPREAPEAVQVAGSAAIRGELPATSGETYGLLGLSASPQGAGLAAVNTGGGPDLVLDGAAQGQTDARLFHDALDRSSASPESFDFRNSGAGTMTLRVDGLDVVTTATDQDSLGALSCANGKVPKRAAGGWTCGDDFDTLGGLPCPIGQIAKVGPGGNWVCAPDDDSLAALACPDGQIAKRVAGVWACAPDDTGSAGIWSSYPEGSDVRVVNQQGNRVAVGNRAMQPVGSAPSEDGALTVSHKAPLPLTTQYNLTLDGRGIQARLAPDMFSPQQDAPLLINRYGGGVAIGKNAPPTRAGLEVLGSIGNTMAILQRTASGQGLALVGDWPGLYANAYFDGGVKTMSGSGYAQLINFQQADGSIAFQTSTAPNTAADVPAATIAERLRISKEGALLSSLTQNQFNLAPLAVISASYLVQSNGAGGLTVTTLKQVVRSSFPVNLSVSTISEVAVRLTAQVQAPGNAELIPVLGTSATGWFSGVDTTVSPVSANTFEVAVFDSSFSGMLFGRTWHVQVVVYGMN